MPTQWAVDFGTTNTVVAMAQEGDVRVIHLPGLCREQPTEQPLLIPSAVHVSQGEQTWLGLFRRRALEVRIGQLALNRNFDGRSPGFEQSFKLHLGSQPHRPAARVGTQELSVREVTRLFLEELLAAIAHQCGDRITHLTIPAPVGFYEGYRAELQAITRRLGVRSFRSLDEPISSWLPSSEEERQVYRLALETIESAIAPSKDLPLPAAAPLPSPENLPVPAAPPARGQESLPIPAEVAVPGPAGGGSERSVRPVWWGLLRRWRSR